MQLVWSKYHIWSNLFIFAPRQVPLLDNTYIPKQMRRKTALYTFASDLTTGRTDVVCVNNMDKMGWVVESPMN